MHNVPKWSDHFGTLYIKWLKYVNAADSRGSTTPKVKIIKKHQYGKNYFFQKIEICLMCESDSCDVLIKVV